MGVATMTRDELIEKYLGIVYSVAWEMKRGLPNTVEIDDLIADGMLGLLMAAEKFEPQRGFEFTTYARWRVRGMMLDGLRQRDVVARRTNWDPDDQRLQPAIRLDAPVRGPAGESTEYGCLGDLIPDDAADFDGVLANYELVEWVLRRIPQRLRDILFAIYWDDRPMHEIGLELGVTESRVSQMHSEALHKMRLALLDCGLGTKSIKEAVRNWLYIKGRANLNRTERSAMFDDLLAFWAE